MFRNILFILLIIAIIRTIWLILKTFSQIDKQQSEPLYKGRDAKSKINKDDIIDAEFEDITQKKSDKSKE